jgi:membrane fusion protein, copper/silver efflux system
MSNKIKIISSLFVAAMLGSLLTVVVYSTVAKPTASSQESGSDSEKDQPLYWVAPMDPNYKRDKPGKSPMGMDLIPVYKNGDSDSEEGPGTIKISPDVINNLGVRTTLAVRRALHSEINTVGYVQYDQDQLVHIHPRVEGWIEKLYVKASGNPVEKGQPLYEIYSPALVNAQEELVLALDRKNRRLIQAARDRLNALQLPKSAIKDLIKTKKVKQSITFFAPQSGVIDNLNIREGFFVKPGTTLMSIGNLDQVWVEAEVFERQVFQLAPDLPVTMSLAFLPGRTWQGKVDYVYPTLDTRTRTVKVRLRFDNADNELKPNMFAQIVIHAQSEETSLLVPREAVIRTGSSDRVVLAMGEGRYKSIAVRVGRMDNNSTEILSGINTGERVVSSAQFLLDSESSKTSDFKRMSHQNENNIHDAIEPDRTATITGVINNVMASHRMLNISRGPIKKWNRPAATLDFVIDQSIDMSTLVEGMSIQFTFYLDDGDFIISTIEDTKITSESVKHSSSHNEMGGMHD